MRQFEIGMAPVRVDKDWLVRTVRSNRQQHHAVFVKACKQFKTLALQRLEALVDEVAAGKVRSLHVPLPIPEEHTEDYDRAIRMLERHVDPTVELTEDAYRCLVDDEWGWRRSFLSNTVAYSSGFPVAATSVVDELLQ